MSELWTDYGLFTEKQFDKSPMVASKLYERSVRNCPSAGSLWAGLIRGTVTYSEGSKYANINRKEHCHKMKLPKFFRDTLMVEWGLQTIY